MINATVLSTWVNYIADCHITTVVISCLPDTLPLSVEDADINYTYHGSKEQYWMTNIPAITVMISNISNMHIYLVKFTYGEMYRYIAYLNIYMHVIL